MTILMITPYAPYRDGIAVYAVQEVRAMRQAGLDVEVLSPLPSAAHRHLVIGSATGMSRLLRLAGSYDKIIMQFYPELLFGGCRGRIERLAVWRLLKQLALKVPLELRIHEIDYGAITIDPLTLSTARSALQAAAKLQVHTAAEATTLADSLDLDLSTIELVEHGGNFEPRTAVDKETARAEFGLEFDEHVFVSIGFIQSHKGCDRGVRAFGRAGLGKASARYIVVGSTRVDHPDLVSYAEELQALCDATPGAEFRHEFVGDEEFDAWLVAADTLVLPYRDIWSSGVLERAALFSIPVITTAVGGLADQAPEGALVVENDSGLTKAMAEAAGQTIDLRETHLLSRAELTELIHTRSGRTNDIDQRSPVEQVGQVTMPKPHSARPGVGELKQFVQRATAWQLQPIIDQLNQLQASTAASIAELKENQRE